MIYLTGNTAIIKIQQKLENLLKNIE